ncbi:MAG: efflux RND transporter permease subunit [Chloroflexi bacterium]|nr:efflux RND transporter permease subunit [Chloroflexota bacterium]
MAGIVRWSLRFRRLVVALAAVTIIFGFTQLSSAPVDTLPEFSPPYVEVQTEALGLSAEEVEQLITVPLEADLLNGVAWLDKIESQSVQGLSSIVMTFEPGTDPIRARQVVAERLTQAHALPNVSKPPVMLQPLSSSNRVLMISLTSDELSLIDMSVLARWTVKPRLLGVPGVANVSIWGQRERQLQVLVDPHHLQAAGVSLDEVVETAGNALWVSPLSFLEASTPGTGGFIDTPNQRLGVQHVLPIDSADDLAQVTVASEDARYRLGDVATVVEDHQPLIGDAIVGEGDGLLLVVEKFPGTDTLTVTRDVEDAMAALAPAITGIDVDTTLFRPATFLEQALDNVTLAILIGLILAIAVITALLRDWRAGVVSLVTIPLSLVLGGLVLLALGATFNAMVAAGLVVALAIVIDDTVTTSASIRARADGASGGTDEASTLARTVRGVIAVRGTTFYTLVVLGLSVIPLFFVGSELGAMLPSLATALIVALLASVLVSITVAPALAFMLGSGRPAPARETRLIARGQAAYGTTLTRVLDRSRPMLLGVSAVAVVAVLGFGAWVAPGVASSATPEFRDRNILVHWDGAPGSSHGAMRRIVAEASADLRAIPGLENVGAHIGRAIFSDQVGGINDGDIWLTIAPDADYSATVAAVEQVVAGFPGMSRGVATYGADRVEQIVGTETDDIVVRVYGEDQAVLGTQADAVLGAVRTIPGVAEARIDAPTMEPTVRITVDLAAAELNGLTPGAVRRTATTLLSGLEVGSLFEGQKVFEVVVWGVPALRENLSTIQALPIETSTGRMVTLADVADIEIAPAPVSIYREGVQRVLDVAISVAGRDVGGVLRDVETALAGVAFPVETHAEVLGLTAERSAQQGALLAVGAAALIGILLVLQAALVSWRVAALVLLSLPAALSGGIVVALVLGTQATFGALLGLLAVLAIAVKQALLLMDHYRDLEAGGATRDEWLVIRGARERMVPTVTTALAVAAALVPFAILGNQAGAEIIHPMSLVVLGGLGTTLLVNLFFLPSLLTPMGMSPEVEEVAIPVETAERRVIGAS